MQLLYQTFEDNFTCIEITVKEYKDFLKSFYGDDINSFLFLDNFLNLMSRLSKKPIEYFKNLSLLDLFLLLVQLRIYSLGNICQIVFKSSDTTGPKQTVSLNLDRIKEDLLLYWDFHFPSVVQTNEIKLEIQFPTITNLSFYSNPNCYIKSCTLTNEGKQQTLSNITPLDAEVLLNKLPADISFQFYKTQKKLLADLNELNFLTDYKLDEPHFLGFDLNVDTFMWYTKLFFSESLDVLYDNLFYLSKFGKLDLNYLENNCTPGEYIYYVKKVQELLSKQAESQAQQNQQAMIGAANALNGI